MLLKMPSQVREAIELENKQPDEVVQWDSPVRDTERSHPEHGPRKLRDRSKSPLKPLQLGNSWSPGKRILHACFIVPLQI